MEVIKMNQYLIDMLKEGRLKKGLRQSDVSKITGIKANTISNYENGVSEPDIDTYLELCKLYELDYISIMEFAYNIKNNSDVILSTNEKDLITSYRKLDVYGKDTINQVLKSEYNRVKEQSMKIEEPEILYTYPKTEYLTGLSAGTGLFVFDDIPTQLIQVPEEYKNADFVIGVSGNSMEPTYFDGDKVAVKKQQCIGIGDIGVFMIGGNGYIKELGDGKLISHNKAYADIQINESTTCIGKVLGKL